MYRNSCSVSIIQVNFMPNSSPALFDCNEVPKQGADSYLFYENSIHDDFLYSLLWWFVYQVLEHEAGKITVQTLGRSFRILFQEHWFKRAQSSGIIFAMLLQTTFCLTRRHHKQVLPVQEPSNYFRGSKMLSSFIHFCNIHSDTCLHTLVSFSLPVSKYTPILKYKLQLSIITLSYCGTLPS